MTSAGHLRLLGRYGLAKLVKWLQRVTFIVALGFGLVIGSHWWPDDAEREWLRDAGGGVMAFGFARWLSQQGQRRRDPETGREKRTPTLRMTPDEAEVLRRIFRR